MEMGDEMRIGLYLHDFARGWSGGIATYALNLVPALAEVDHANEYVMLLNQRSDTEIRTIKSPNFEQITFNTLPIPPLPLRAVRRLWTTLGFKPFRFPSEVKNEQQFMQQVEDLDLQFVHYLSYAKQSLFMTLPVVLTFFDMVHEFYPELFSKRALEGRIATCQPATEKAVRIITASNFTKKTLIERYGTPTDKIEVVRVGPAPEFKYPVDPDLVHTVRHKYSLPDTFIFFPANPWPYKNHSRLFEAMKVARDRYGLRYKLVVTGRLEVYPKMLQSQIHKAGLEDCVMDLGYVTQSDMPPLYAAASMLIFPSLFEGLGQLVLEAMACGTPVACSNVASLPEMTGDAALLFDPLDVEDIAGAIHRLLTDQDLRADLIQRGLWWSQSFSWEETAQQTIAVYEKAGQLIAQGKARSV